MSKVIFKKEDHFTVIATDEGGGRIESQSVQTLLLFEILKELKKINLNTKKQDFRSMGPG